MRRILLLLVTVAALASGCATTNRHPDLDGTRWTLTGWSAGTNDPVKYRISAGFEDDRISGKGPVNRYTATYQRTRRGGLTLSQPVSTMMAGTEDFMQGEKTFFELLERVRSYRRESGVLTLSDDTGQALLVFSPLRE